MPVFVAAVLAGLIGLGRSVAAEYKLELVGFFVFVLAVLFGSSLDRYLIVVDTVTALLVGFKWGRTPP